MPARPADGSPQPARVASYGPNGTHWPDDTPWYHAKDIPNVVEVDCTWAAIASAIDSFSPEQVEQGAAVQIRPGTLRGRESSDDRAPVMTRAGSDRWARRVLVRPRDGFGTVDMAGNVRIQEVQGVCLAGLTGGDFMMTGCTNSALAWTRLASYRVVGLGGTDPDTDAPTGQPTTRCDSYEVVVPEPSVGDLDPAGTGSGYPGPAGPADGNGWIHDCLVVGCYTAPQYLPVDEYDADGEQTAGYGHNDSWQLYGASLYWAMTFEDCAFWGSNNAALQIGGFAGSDEESEIRATEELINDYYGTTGPITHFLSLTHTLLLDAETTAAVRYPRPPGTSPFTSTAAINGGGAARRLHAREDNLIVGGIYSSAIWGSVDPTTRIHPSTRSTIMSGGGSWNVDPALGRYTAQEWDALCPPPTDEYLRTIWT
ncbi:hypothetical protein O2W18_01055 [Modestobacter sp. VKM Ac-2983]|uniref:hypothetical protein n=1 Tax=Modestobacter sp. VKM Ac-2983 TaxID=3004137 RepID=UPI0022AB6537|nr:hypothetical protein [Modestobacter sp. VKM Ac-2983]MCZ2803688.1 hypothetical protein [Modestobacter sp. VKM Ac-2983]